MNKYLIYHLNMVILNMSFFAGFPLARGDLAERWSASVKESNSQQR